MADNLGLNILLTAKDLASGGINSVGKSLDHLSRRGPSVQRAMAGIGKSFAVAGAAAVGFTTLAVKDGIDTLVQRESLMSATAAAIKATGGAAHVSAGEIRQWAQDIENATNSAVDDKDIQDAMNNLLRFPQIGRTVFKRAAADAADLGAAMKTGPQEAAKLLGKALADPVKGMGTLKKAGVVLTASEQKSVKWLVAHNQQTRAQEFLLAAVEKRTKGAAAASAGPYQTAMNKLKDTWEDVTATLAEGFLPVITEAADWLRVKLSDPSTLQRVKDFGRFLADKFGEVADFVKGIDWAGVANVASTIAGAAGKVVNFFSSMPEWVKTAVVSGWGLNKVTGGVLGDVVSSLASGLVKGVLGISAGVVNVNGAVVNGGGVPGTGTTPAANPAGGMSLLTLLGGAGGFLGAAGIGDWLRGVGDSIFHPGQSSGPGFFEQLFSLFGGGPSALEQHVNSLGGTGSQSSGSTSPQQLVRLGDTQVDVYVDGYQIVTRTAVRSRYGTATGSNGRYAGKLVPVW